ncbi:GNAT family N-acetyltransferase [Paenibacillus sp. NFR01]|uniref:GNAT family N-acetyltransferase n=1 Tax=Paenibacillus sp. NFR01 TaxID=1566279 RepID=UPI0008C41928|nr:GNAT family N-acetyltransferase [Paenibacillus sp. NFR01]SES92763.1 Acetyltransferase (GNAT) family protein [Paenibacillus sp. NFR01]
MMISSIFDTTAGKWQSWLAGLQQFVREHGERRITVSAYRQLARLTPEMLAVPGTSLMIATVRGQAGRQLAGFCFVAGYGRDACIVAVHPLYRGRGTGTALLAAQLRRLGRLECLVAADNAASLKMCFNAGLAAVDLLRGPTGKPTLLLRKPEAVISNETNPREGEPLCQNPY